MASRRSTIPGIATLLAVAALLGLAACAIADDGAQLTVFAASSLAPAIDELVPGFESANPGVEVIVVYGGSDSLARQISEGAPADVFASADPVPVRRLTSDDPSLRPITLAHNRAAILLAPDQDVVSTPEDLVDEDTRLAMCAETVPCGRIARLALDDAGLDVNPVTLETSSRAVVSKVASGDVDAGVAYVSDARTAAHRGVTALDLEVNDDVVATYEVVLLEDTGLSRSFVELITSAAGSTALEDAGFEIP